MYNMIHEKMLESEMRHDVSVWLRLPPPARQPVVDTPTHLPRRLPLSTPNLLTLL